MSSGGAGRRLLVVDHALYRDRWLRLLFPDFLLRVDLTCPRSDCSALGCRIGENGGAGLAAEAVLVSAIDVDQIGRTMRVLLERTGRTIVYDDPASGSRLALDASAASAANGFLPAFLVAGEAIWREVTGKGFALDIARDDRALLGYRVEGIGAGTYATVMLSAMEAMHQVSSPGAVVISDFNDLWRATVGRLQQAHENPAPGRQGLVP
jgi:hypothetical protein